MCIMYAGFKRIEPGIETAEGKSKAIIKSPYNNILQF